VELKNGLTKRLKGARKRSIFQAVVERTYPTTICSIFSMSSFTANTIPRITFIHPILNIILKPMIYLQQAWNLAILITFSLPFEKQPSWSKKISFFLESVTKPGFKLNILSIFFLFLDKNEDEREDVEIKCELKNTAWQFSTFTDSCYKNISNTTGKTQIQN
jgi:hypothetical protein